jgi:hypothetical protein
MKTRKTTKTNRVEIMVYGVCALLLVWIGASFIDVLCHNDIETGSHVYATWNAFELLINTFN